MAVLMKTYEIKMKIFCEAFLIFNKIICLSHSGFFHFYKKGFLNSQAVRITVGLMITRVGKREDNIME
jgi:hypothetical protein